MTSTLSADLALIIPELILAVGALALLLVGAYRGEGSSRLVGLGGMAVILAALYFTVCAGGGETAYGFHDMVVIDGFGRFMKVLVLIGALVSIPMSVDFLKRAGSDRFEFPVLILLATAGMMLMVSANDLITLYVGLELQSLSLYVLAAFLRDDARSTEAGLKYFVLGALSSGMLLYGCSLIYGFSGTTNFTDLAKGIATLGEHGAGIGLVIGIVFMVAGLAFKVSAVPFHMWTPDAYEGAPTPTTTFMAVAVKSAAVAMLVRVLLGGFGNAALTSWSSGWPPVVAALAVLTMTVANLVAARQESVKRMLAYSSIAHAGYVLVAIVALPKEGADALGSILFYLLAYTVSTAGAFGTLVLCGSRGKEAVSFEDLAGVGRRHPAIALTFSLFLLSLAGVPGTAGFLAKLYVVRAALGAGLVALALIVVLNSVLAAYYYLRVLVYLYMRQPQRGAPVAQPMQSGYVVTALLICAFGVLMLGLWPARPLDFALQALMVMAAR